MDEDVKTVSLDELQAWVGREHGFAGIDAVTRSDIRRKLEVFCCDCPLYYDDAVARAHGYRGLVAPVVMTPLWGMPAYWEPGEPVFYGPSLRPKAGGIRTDLPNVYPRGVNTATEWEYFEPLYPGDQLSGNWKLIEIKPRKTERLGEGIFLTVETSIYKQSGELVAKNRNTGFRYPDRKDDAPRAKREKPAPTETSSGSEPTMVPVDWQHQLRFGDVAVGDAIPPYTMWLSYQRIVMSVAVDRMWSPIHHDRDRAKAAGFGDIIFNTRSYEMLFEVMLRRWIGLDGKIGKLGPFRMTGSSYPDDVITSSARILEKLEEGGEKRVKLELLVLNPRGEAARGEAQVVLPA
ncbi:MAG TPA: MaoC family dehydratase N-terminal domain-containing protein [Stellaceae bacterium]|jgi:acyl dehydratase|nr:MaoC family dehydratase N-terminal domain-containing protein [Stellaceae bacterium]